MCCICNTTFPFSCSNDLHPNGISCYNSPFTPHCCEPLENYQVNQDCILATNQNLTKPSCCPPDTFSCGYTSNNGNPWSKNKTLCPEPELCCPMNMTCALWYQVDTDPLPQHVGPTYRCIPPHQKLCNSAHGAEEPQIMKDTDICCTNSGDDSRPNWAIICSSNQSCCTAWIEPACCNSDDFCVDQGSNINNAYCCPKGTPACRDTKCCSSGNCCGGDGDCCPDLPGYTCCGKICCDGNCCGGYCCDADFKCCNGKCSDSCDN